MSYDEEQHKRSRLVIETPTARREVVEQQTVRYPPPPDRRGYSAGMLATVALVAIAATAIVFLFLTNSGGESSETNVNIRAAAVPQATPLAQPVIVQTPMMAPTPVPVIVQQVPPTTVPAPVIIQAPPPTDTTAAAPPPTTTAPPAAATDDATLQQKIDAAFAADASVAASNVDATVVNGRVRLAGSVGSDAVKQRAERLAYAVKGVLGVDNKIVVSPGTP